MMKRTFLALAAATLLSACGFTPAHAPGGLSGGNAYKDIQLSFIEHDEADEIDREAEYWLNQRLTDRVGDEGGKHILEIEPRLRRTRLGISGDDIATRYDVSLEARYKLIDAVSGDVLDRGKVEAISTFGAPRDPYGRVTAEKNATRIIASEAADRLLYKLAGYYANPDQ